MLKSILFKVLRYSGLPVLFRDLLHRKKVTILLFHDIHPEDARRSFSYLARHYRIIGLQTYLKYRREKRPLPAKSLIITFDDGLKRNYELLPLLKRKKIPITIFLCAGIVDTSRHFWFSFEHPSIPKSRLKQIPNQEKVSRLKEAGFDLEAEQPERQALTREEILEMSSHVDFQGIS